MLDSLGLEEALAKEQDVKALALQLVDYSCWPAELAHLAWWISVPLLGLGCFVLKQLACH